MTLADDLAALLRADPALTAEGRLLKNVVTERALKLDRDLLRRLLSHDRLKAHFFVDVDGVLVFDRDKFVRFVNNKAFLPDSYTAFKNKIGLTTPDGRYLSESRDVVLAWPYKDCVLQGGQTKEEQKRDEVFWNETLAPDEIDRLLAPKVLTRWRRYTAAGPGPVGELGERDNLIIKGNNLLALHSLYRRFAGKVKLIYIDPPYNIGGDSFRYNDSFSHSTWLVFMKNRLEAAKGLLSQDGAIFVQIDYIELAHLRILCDEIFGRDNFIQIVTVRTATPAGFKVVNPGPVNVSEFILVYAKSKKDYPFKQEYVRSAYQKDYSHYIENLTDPPNKWVIGSVKDKAIQSLGFGSLRQLQREYGKEVAFALLDQAMASFAAQNPECVFATYGPQKPAGILSKMVEESKQRPGEIFFHERDGADPFIVKNGRLFAFYAKKLRNIDGKAGPTQILTDFWDDLSWDSLSSEGGVTLKNGKKPEALLRRIISLGTEPGELVVDFFAGSGTTGAVAHKMGRRYICIEQLDYGKDDSLQRLRNVVGGDRTGISRHVGWQGGGEFVYCELMQWNERYAQRILAAPDGAALTALWDELRAKAHLSYRVDLAAFDAGAAEFAALSVEDQRRFLMEVLDKNQLYVNLSEMDDETYAVSDEDKRLNRQFYGV